MNIFRLIKETLFPKYYYLSNPDYRINIYDGNIQVFSCELGKWKDLDYMEGTNYDAGQWLKIPNNIQTEIFLAKRGLECGKNSSRI